MYFKKKMVYQSVKWTEYAKKLRDREHIINMVK